jgi:hypothetical protein
MDEEEEEEEDAGNDVEYSQLPSGDEDDEDRVEEIADPRRMLPTAAEANAGIDELIAVMSAGGSNDRFKTLEESFGSMELLTSGKGMAGLDAVRRRRMTMGASDRGDAEIWRGRPPKKEGPTFKSMIKPPPEAVRRTLDECRREADSTERVRAAMKVMERMDQPASALIGEGGAAGGWEFGEEFALDALVAERDTFKCKCGKPFAAAMNATRHVASGQCTWNKDDRKKKKKKDLKKNKDRGPAATKEQLTAFLVAMSPQARVDFFKSIGTDKDGREWQTKWLVLRAIRNRHEDHFLTGFHPEKIWGPGESLQRHLAKVRRAIERLGIFDGDKDLNGSADIVGEAVKVFQQYAANCAVLRDYIEDPDQARDMEAAELSKFVASIDAVSEETFLSSGKYGGAVDNPDAMCAGINQEAALAYMTEVALVNAYVAARSAEAEAERRKLLAELDEAAADEERREARRLKEKAKKAKAKANKKKGVESSPEPAAAASAAEKEKESEADFEKDDDDAAASDRDDDDEEEEAERAREKERAEAEAEAAKIARRRAAEAAAEAAELAEREARELAAAERRLEMEMAARAIAKSAAEEEATRRRSGEVDPGGGRSIAGGGLLGVMANGVVASPYGKARPKKSPPNQPGLGKPPQRPNAANASTEASADAVAEAPFVPPLPPGPPPAAAAAAAAAGRSPEGKPQTTATATTTTTASPAARAHPAAPVVKPRPAAFDPSKQPTRASPAPVVSSASVAPGSSRHPAAAGRGKSGAAGMSVNGGYGSATGTGVNSGTGASSLSESDYRSSDAEGGGARRPSRRDRAVARAAAKAEAARSGRESGNSSQSEQPRERRSGGGVEVYRRDAAGPAKTLSEVEGMLLAAAERTEAQARRARAAAEEAEASLRSKEKARAAAAAEEDERRGRREEAEAKKSAAAVASPAPAPAPPKVKYCTQCGERQTEGARFCSGCGVPLAKPADSAADASSSSSSPPAAAAPPPPPYAHYPAPPPPPPPYAGYPGGAPGVPPGDLGAEYSALYLQHYHAALAAITQQQQQQYAQGHYAGAYPGGYPAYDPHVHPYGATAAPGAPPPPPPPMPRGPPPRKE